MTDKSIQTKAWVWLLLFAAVTGGVIYYNIRSATERHKAFEAQYAAAEKERIAAKALEAAKLASYEADRKKRAGQVRTEEDRFGLILNDCQAAINAELAEVNHLFADSETVGVALYLAGFHESQREHNIQRLKAGAASVEYVVVVYPPDFSSFAALWSCKVDPDGLGSSRPKMERRFDLP
jgi:hypothetical protein